jgi:hypothetical protein
MNIHIATPSLSKDNIGFDNSVGYPYFVRGHRQDSGTISWAFGVRSAMLKHQKSDSITLLCAKSAQ